MPSTALAPVPRTYAQLRRAVEAVVFKGREQIERAWVQTYHECGHLIHEHLLLKKDRAAYGAQIYAQLSADAGISIRTLHECVQFYRAFPILRARAKLTWTHYRLLAQVGDPALRERLLAETEKHGWSYRELETRVRTLNLDDTPSANTLTAANVTPPKLLTPKRGTAGVCKVVDPGDGPVVDLGFATYRDLSADTDFKAGDFTRLDDAGRIHAAPGATKADLFTYPAVILKVVDGDTLWVKVYLHPGHWVKQKLRFRDLDCPELATPEGKAAKRFVDALNLRATACVICTTKPDKYDRYLADIFLTLDDGTEIFLNNALLENGHAVPKQAWEFSDWGSV